MFPRWCVKWRLVVLPFVLLIAGCGSPEERAKGYYQKGMELIAKKDDFGARVALTTAIKFKNDKVEFWRALVGVEERLKSAPASLSRFATRGRA